MGSFCSKSLGINFGSEYSGSSVADDGREPDFSNQQPPGNISMIGPGMRQFMVKDVKEQNQLKDVFSFRERVAEDNFYDGIPTLAMVPSPKLRSAKSTQTAVSKVTEASVLLGKAGLGKAKDVLDTLGSSMTDLSSGGFTSGVATKGNELGILAFEVANTIVKSSNLIESLSKRNIKHLKEIVLYSEGVQNLVSNDFDELFRLVAADKRQELQVFSGEVVRFGNRSKDAQWHFLQRYFDRISKELTPQRQLMEDAVLVVGQLMVLVQYTAELYQELQVLYRLEKDYEQKRREEDNSANSSKGDGFVILKTELKSQRKVVKSLKKKSLWSRSFEEVMEKLVDIVHFLLLEIHNIFGGADDHPSKRGAADHDKRLGPAGLALHYANIIVQIDTLVARASSITSNARDSLYQSLPPGIKLALRSKIKSFNVDKELSVTQIKDEMEKTLHWLVPIAANTTKAHHGFGWVGEWANTGIDFTSKPSDGDILRIETLYHASKEKTEIYILGQIIWLQHLVTKAKSDARGGPRLSSIKSPLNTTNQHLVSEPLNVPLVTVEEQNMLQEASKKKRTPCVSKSQDFDSEYSRARKCDPLSKSSEYFRGVRRSKSAAVKRFSSGFPLLDFVIDKEKVLDVIDRVDVPRDYKALLKEGSLSF
ncbi:Protein PSK SIMULATOR 3 [Cardamine amara subsp. amara]|uniref:Protein PSK SIMULATOR 3 n=1 Tax=Cardamine amara subsp. amara TaxID=228776 RepID=A0ABD0ZQS8_CARAN